MGGARNEPDKNDQPNQAPKPNTTPSKFCLIVHQCFRCPENGKPLQELDYEDCPKAIRVLVSESDILEAKAFHSTMRVRHACLDAGFSTISPQDGSIATP